MGEESIGLGQRHDLAAKALLEISGVGLAGKGQHTGHTANSNAALDNVVRLMHIDDTAVNKIA